MYKLTQFVDDTTIILDGTTKSLKATVNMLGIFGDMSGLIMNREKQSWFGSEVNLEQRKS